MSQRRLLLSLTPAALAIVCCVSLAQAASPGSVNLVANSNSLLNYLTNPTAAVKQWFQTHVSAIVAYPPDFNSDLAWFPQGYAYFDLYGIMPGAEETTHDNWILHDQNGKWLYLPYACSGGSCAQYAANIANPEFRRAWIAEAAGSAYGAGYAGVFIDDVNLNFSVSDGDGNFVAPIDTNTGQPMTYDAWRNYMATFLEEAHAAMPHLAIMENPIWYAGPPGVLQADPFIQRQIKTANTIVIERGINDSGLTGGTGTFSLYALFNYIDAVHAAGAGVSMQQYSLSPAAQQYGLAGYFLVSDGNDSIGDSSTSPDNLFPGYTVNLGNPLGPRTYNNGIFQRNFTNGMVLVGEPGLTPQNVSLGGSFTTLDGTSVSSVTLNPQQGYVLLGAGATGPITPSGPAPPATPVVPPATPAAPDTPPQTAVLNAASQAGGAISPGELVSIPGAYSGALQIKINGTTAPIVGSTSNLLSAIVPYGLDMSQPSSVLINEGPLFESLSIPVAPASPGIFTIAANGSGQGAILNQDYTPNSATNPASEGTVIMIYGTGFGALNPSPTDGQIVSAPANTVTPVTATIGGASANVLYAGAAPGLIAGTVQINVQIPAGLGANPAAPVTLTMGSVTTQPGVTIAVQ